MLFNTCKEIPKIKMYVNVKNILTNIYVYDIL